MNRFANICLPENPTSESKLMSIFLLYSIYNSWYIALQHVCRNEKKAYEEKKYVEIGFYIHGNTVRHVLYIKPE